MLSDRTKKRSSATFVFFVILFCLNSCNSGRLIYDKKEISVEKFRPKIHFTSEKNWINDPNGLVFLNGNYHLFYQHNPFGNSWGHMSWGHAVSSDLYNWKEEPVAMDEKGYFFYPRMKFSGSVVLDSKNTSGLCINNANCLVAIYTEFTLLNQTQNIAVSHNEGRSFVEYAENPVINERSLSFRDPKVFWHEQTSKWIMAVAKPSAKKIAFYSSDNLKDWAHLSDFRSATQPEGIWECPDLFYLPLANNSNKGKWVLLLSVADTARGSFMEYFIGNFDGKTFVADASFSKARNLDYGYDFYAAISWENLPPTERKIIGWMSNWEYASSIPTYPWRGSMSLPRKLSLKLSGENYSILQNPDSGIEKFKIQNQPIKNITLNNDNVQIPLNDDGFEFNAEFTDIAADEIGIRIKTSDESATFMYKKTENSIQFDRKNFNKIRFDKAFDNLSLSKADVGRLDQMDLKIILDGSNLEIFALKGEVVFTNLVFPKEKISQLEIYSKNGSVSVKRISLAKFR